MFEADVREFVTKVSNLLVARGWKLATAESCTGGWIAKCCTDIAGSSDWFERGFVTYSNQAKVDMLGVAPEVLDSAGAVSRAVAEQMVLGARRLAPVEVSVAVTGIAGPDGGSPDKPVGTVWFAWSVGEGGVSSQCCRFEGDRDAVRRQTVIHAVQVLQRLLDEPCRDSNGG